MGQGHRIAHKIKGVRLCSFPKIEIVEELAILYWGK